MKKIIRALQFWKNWKRDENAYKRGVNFALNSIEIHGIERADAIRATKMNEMVALKVPYTDFHKGYEHCIANERGAIVQKNGVWNALSTAL